MYCSECGNKIPDKAKFCSFCGTQIAYIESYNSEVPLRQFRKENKVCAENKRKGMLLYLQDIMSMQFSINKLENILSAEKSPINIHDNWYFWKCYKLQYPIAPNDFQQPYKYLYLSYSYKLNQYYYKFTSRNCEDLYDNRGNKVHHNYGNPCTASWESTVLSAEIRKKLFTLPMIKVKRGFFGDINTWVTNSEDTYWPSYTIRDNGYRLEPFSQVIQIIEHFEAAVKEREETYRKNLPIRRKKIRDLDQEIGRAQQILNDLYSVNIIPSKYRDIGCAYFIYEFFSTSNSPLENVFLHLDLDMIQSQISTVIKNQQKQILQQAIIISQNKEIIEQNQLVLDNLATLQKDTSNMNAKLDSINANSAEAAEWARIAASHAEACAWLGVANYIKDM